MDKVSSKDAQTLLKQAAVAIRTLVSENKRIGGELNTFRKEARAEALAKQMEDKGLNNELDFHEKVAQLKEATNLDITEEAIKLATPQMEIGGMSDIPGTGTHPFEHFISTGEDITQG